MKIVKYPAASQWADIIKRPHIDTATLSSTVHDVLADVRQNGDAAVRKYGQMFDKVEISSLQVSDEEKAEARQLVNDTLKEAIALAHSNIKAFHESQAFESKKVETCPGVSCWQKSVAIERVGLYVPGGTAPLFSTVLMLATPAKIAVRPRSVVPSIAPSRPSPIRRR